MDKPIPDFGCHPVDVSLFTEKVKDELQADMKGWRSQCGRVACNFLDAASTMTSPMQLDGASNVSRKTARSRLLGARRLADRATLSIDKLLAALDHMDKS